MTQAKLHMQLLPDPYGICRLTPKSSIPTWALQGDFFSITQTADELSIVCLESSIPSELPIEKNWRVLKVIGPLDFALTGILAAISTVLAAAQISIFALSTYDTDYILVKEKDIDRAVAQLRQNQYVITGDKHD